ncbi:prepilin-type N-terminal cleavage/methylation domain-containing protein [Virgibacillus halodenitrificans]|nr:prepilin-type N-terminal cleavage/methylation domain-containing protein [Virgibacillus halodenitrificans]
MRTELSVLLRQMANKNGFTLIEMLLVLSIVSILSLLSVTWSLSAISKQEKEQFINTLENDTLYIQQVTSIKGDLERPYITFNENFYTIYFTKRKKPIIRNYPPGVRIDRKNHQYLRFEQNGNIRQPRSLHLYLGDERYKVIFPFGKGRFYLEKE